MDISLTNSFTSPADLFLIVSDHILYISSKHHPIIDTLLGFIPLQTHGFFDEFHRNIFYESVLAGLDQELKVFFTVPDQQILSKLTPTLNSNEVVAAFINFLLLMVEVILHFEEDSIARVKGSFQNLRTELGFLITFLGDTAMHLQPTETIVIDIEDVVNEVGCFLYSFLWAIVMFILICKEKELYTRMYGWKVGVNEVGSLRLSDFIHFLEDQPLLNTMLKATKDIKASLHKIGSLLDSFISKKNDQAMEPGNLNLALSDLLAKFETLKTKIKEHCIRVSKIPSDMAPKTGVVSLFIVDSVLDDLMDLINNKSDSTGVVNDQIVMLQTLQKELMLLGSSITDIALQQEAEHEELVIRSRDIAYEVEYVIKSFRQAWYLSLRLPQLIDKIQLITMAIEKMKNNVDISRMSIFSKHPHEHVDPQSEESPILEDFVVGFDNVTIEIVEQLARGIEKLQIISIFGMPGLGKTTLANKLYNHRYVLYHFHNRAWCAVSQIYNKKNVLIEILSSMSNNKRDTYMKKEENSLVDDLYKNLKGRRYLIVIDDIWDINVWNDLKRCFPDDGVGSRILFTTRNKEVGLKALPHNFTKELPFLSEVECWDILQGKVFQDKKCPQELLDIGKQIAKNCHGLPLAVVVIAGVLANMEKKKHLWEKVARNLGSHISEIPEKCIQILQLSYDHLPMHLKTCFLYFGAFKGDMKIPVRKLISLWVAEGFIKKEEQKNIEDVAREYLMKLIDRSLVLVAEKRYDGGVKTCKIHDLLREMCLKIAEENNFLKFIKHNDDDEDKQRFFSQVSTYQQHHCLSINCTIPPSSLPFGLHVRSLLYDIHFVGSSTPRPTTSISCSHKLLRVFDFSSRSLPWGLIIGLEHLVLIIGLEHLVHLRYLALSCTRPPLNLERFHKLEFLVVDNDVEVEIPEILLNTVSLRHMEFKGGARFSESSCQLATNSKNFQINNLRSISRLSIYVELDEKVLGRSPNLRRLKGRVDKDLLNPSFDFLNQLESLKLYEIFHCSFSLPLNLKKLTLDHAKVSRKQMEIIGRLPCLEVLKLESVAFEEEQWNTSEGEFPQLKYLKLANVNIAEWNASSDHFPEIWLYGCPPTTNESAKEIKEEQKAMGNEELEVMISEKQLEENEYNELLKGKLMDTVELMRKMKRQEPKGIKVPKRIKVKVQGPKRKYPKDEPKEQEKI
ncbi:putative late blight resistance protein homolog R1A-3 isoform X2 [Olea europaea var. sylvestris]|uniref:putative late blight resistance protein homolog R1A-3 isoform X2 n=1 Tax=Olea europaea var. sylvestris TaxID=158386 RepID=UPI000C1D405F|nr:putative late blight resistance protein homolog R1A-3 isoform X2 [Olea europaea var. sylvestris]